MDYEKLYKEVLERASKYYNANTNKGYREIFEDIFHEFKKSEDERIRKGIICGMNALKEQHKETFASIPINDCIAWLEKQKEIKMIQWTGDNLKEVTNFTGLSPEFSNWFKSWDDFESYVHSHNDVFKLFFQDGSHYEVPKGAWIVRTPDGYNVASRSKFVEKQGEQKPADKIKPKFKVGDIIKNIKNGDTIKVEQILNNSYCYSGWDGAATIHSDFLISDQDNWELIKPAWSEEDEQNLNFWLDNNKSIDSDKRNWLNSLKDRVQSQPTSEWSDEDEKFFITALWHISYSISNGKSTDIHCDTTEWLKSLKDRMKGE